MKSHRGSWLGFCLLAAGLVMAPGLSTSARAQPGFGLDPFWPYNAQYTPYTTPIGPASPEAGGRGAVLPRSGVMGANQFQSYLDGLQGGSRTASDRSNIGTPYYRSAVDPSSNPRISREYQANALTNAEFERNQREVADTYFAYFTERDPKKRAELLRDYRQARRDATRSLTNRSRSRPRIAGETDRADDQSGRAAEPGMGSALPGRARSTQSPTGRFGPAPEVPGAASTRSPGSRTRRASPTEILNRSRAMDRSESLLPSSRSRASARRRTELSPIMTDPALMTDPVRTTTPAPSTGPASGTPSSP